MSEGQDEKDSAKILDSRTCSVPCPGEVQFLAGITSVSRGKAVCTLTYREFSRHHLGLVWPGEVLSLSRELRSHSVNFLLK